MSASTTVVIADSLRYTDNWGAGIAILGTLLVLAIIERLGK